VRLNLRTFDKVSPIYRLGVGAFIYEPTPNRANLVGQGIGSCRSESRTRMVKSN
jgi:hypothetical protein